MTNRKPPSTTNEATAITLAPVNGREREEPQLEQGLRAAPLDRDEAGRRHRGDAGRGDHPGGGPAGGRALDHRVGERAEQRDREQLAGNVDRTGP